MNILTSSRGQPTRSAPSDYRMGGMLMKDVTKCYAGTPLISGTSLTRHCRPWGFSKGRGMS